MSAARGDNDADELGRDQVSLHLHLVIAFSHSIPRPVEVLFLVACIS